MCRKECLLNGIDLVVVVIVLPCVYRPLLAFYGRMNYVIQQSVVGVPVSDIGAV